MRALDSVEVTAEQVRLRRERRTLTVVLTLLLVTTALVSPLAFGDLPLLLLLACPFALALLCTVLVAPLSVSAAAARSARDQAAALQSARREAAAKHAILTPRRNTLPEDDPTELARAVDAASAHGIHFGCAELSSEHFLQAFHAGELRAADFRHGDHLRYTALMLQRVPTGLVEETIAKNLRTFLRQVCGSEALFHATRTHAWITVVRAHLAMPRASFANLLQQHAADLHGSALNRFYSAAMLESEEARRRVVKPDLEPLPAFQAPIRSNT